ncbi:MAG: methyltransferase domain-containing protein [Planctomycetia bacterium]|nr:methyltransferase domain-containing protein [Planctomycetia bacterium]
MTQELPAIPGGWTTREFHLARSTLRITLPAAPDDFLDDPDVLAANRRDDYMPYWSYLWPASLETAVAVLRHDWPPETSVLEIGAGIALSGQAALARGLKVSFSDYDQRAIDLALFNARQNQTERNAEGLLLDWRAPIDRQFPVIFGCDVIYEKQNHRPILGLLKKMLAPDGEAWISDPGRHQANAFLELLADSPFKTRHRSLAREPYSGRPAGTTNLWIVSWK